MWGTAIQLSVVLDTYDDTCLPASKSSPLQCYVASTFGPQRTYSPACGRFRHPRRSCSSATVTRQPELVPLRFLLQEAVLFPGEMECLRLRALGLFSGITVSGTSGSSWRDHKPLTYALSCSTDAWTAKQCRQLSYMAEFTSDIQHVPGQENVVADALSRPSSTSRSP